MDKNIFKQISPNKLLGQNFLLSKKALEEIVRLADLDLDDIVLEIGAGTGILTEELAVKAKKVIAIEKDKELIFILEERFKKYKNIKIVSGDIREMIGRQKGLMALRSYKVVANLPYYLSSYIIRRFLEIENKPETMVLMLQKELAERICAKVGKMSLISVMVNFYGKPKLGSVVKKENFYPQPKVDSQILIIDDIKSPENINEKVFFRILHIGFSQKRKKLINNLYNGLKIDKNILLKATKSLNLKETVRAQELSLGDWEDLYQKIGKIIG